MEDRFRFRVWDKGNEKYIYDAVYAYDGNSYKGKGDNLGHIYCFGEYLDDQEGGLCVVEQCTGLKDKNGKLIYEGDIVKDLTFNEDLAIIKFGNSDDFGDGYQCFYPEWLGKYSKRTKYSMGWRRGLVWWCNNGIEVVGNIHEDSHLLKNPELLEE